MKKILSILFLTAALALPVCADPQEDQKNLQGTWEGTMQTDQGDMKISMEVKDKQATFTLKNSNGETAMKFKCDYKLEMAGKFRVFTFSNAEVVDGDNKGQKFLTDGESRSAIYKLDSESLTTAGGFLDNDDNPPSLIRWKKK